MTVVKTVNKVNMSVVDNNVFMFSFKHVADIRRIWDYCHWSCKGEHLILKKYELDWSFNGPNLCCLVRFS